MKRLLVFLLLAACTLWGEDVYATFDVVAPKESKLAFSVGGVVAKLYADVGSSVKKGDLLAELDSDDLIASLAVSRAELESAKEQLAYAQKQYERMKQIRSVISAEEFDRYEFDYRLKEKNVKQVEAAIAYKEALLSKSRLRAPFGGLISQKAVEVGEGVAPNQTIFILVSANERKLMIHFDEKYAHQVKPGQEFSYVIDGKIAGRAKITKVYPTVDPKNRKATAEAIVRNTALKPGLFGEGTIKVP
ncbi:MAG: efflux RND transporter periplasmic adaptor subunit [Campylobacterales bacterium]